MGKTRYPNRQEFPLRTSATSLIAAISVAGCGGGATQPVPNPPPPPPPPPAVSLDLQPGEMRVLSDAAEVSGFELSGAGEAREYQVILMSGSQVEGALTPIRLRAQAASGSPSIAPVQGSRVASGAGVHRDPGLSTGQTRLDRMKLRPGHLALLGEMREEIRRRRPRISPGAAFGVRPGIDAAAVPTVGQTISVTSALTPDGGITCAGTSTVDGVVRAVGANFILLEDVAAAGHLTAQDFVDLDAELDAYVAPVNRAFFGDPPDLDGNGRVIVFFTYEVNRSGDAIGFFNPLDMFDPADCPASNGGEILWLFAPDPDGTAGGDHFTVEEVKSISRGLVAHEFQHLLGNFQRFLGGATGPDDVWIEEALSHIAQEVAGFYRIGVGTRAGLGFTETGIGAVEGPAFYDFHEANFGNMGVYLRTPEAAPSLAVFDNPEYTFAMRGWGYLFLRWLADRYAPAAPESIVGGSAEDLLFREIAVGGPSRMIGIPNLLRAVAAVSGASPTWDELLAEYFAAPALVNAQVTPDDVPFRTWDLARTYAEMATNAVPELSSGYPLQRTDITMSAGVNRSITFDVGASAARYFRFTATDAHPDMRVEFTTPSGGQLPGSPRPRVIVVRTR